MYVESSTIRVLTGCLTKISWGLVTLVWFGVALLRVTLSNRPYLNSSLSITDGVEILIVPMLVLKPLSKAFNCENCLKILLSESKESSETFQEA